MYHRDCTVSHRVAGPLKSKQCGQLATHDGMFSYSAAIFITAMIIKNIKLRVLSDISHSTNEKWTLG